MDEYINREAALVSLCTACDCVSVEDKELCPYKLRFAGCQEYAIIAALPAADVRHVVTCKDCVENESRGRNSFYQWCGLHGEYHTPDWFCGDAEEERQ